jgi:putative ABC transport system permease protein
MDKIWYNIKTGFRYLTRQKNISLMNLLGLSIRMSVAILIFYFVSFEMSYDSFHKNGKLIYRIISVNKGTRGTDYRVTTPLPLTGYTADSCFLKIFNFPLISCNPC